MKTLLNPSQRQNAKILINKAKSALDSNNTLAASKLFYHLFSDVFYQVMPASKKQDAKVLINKAKSALDSKNALAASKPFYHLFNLLYPLMSDSSQRQDAKILINSAQSSLDINDTLAASKPFYHLFVLLSGAYTHEISKKRFHIEGEENDTNDLTQVNPLESNPDDMDARMQLLEKQVSKLKFGLNATMAILVVGFSALAIWSYNK